MKSVHTPSAKVAADKMHGSRCILRSLRYDLGEQSDSFGFQGKMIVCMTPDTLEFRGAQEKKLLKYEKCSMRSRKVRRDRVRHPLLWYLYSIVV